MDATLKQIISSFETGLTAYREKLGAGNAKLTAALAVFAKLSAAAEAAKDMMDFYGRPEGQALMGQLSAMMPELAKEQPVQGQRSVPAASAVAAGYHMAYDQMPKDDPATNQVYERVFACEREAENAAVFLRMLAEEGLFLKLAAVPLAGKNAPLIENARKLSLPVMAICHERTLARVRAARSVAELEYETNLEAELSIYQNRWDQQFLSCTSILLCGAITSWMLTHHEDDRQEVENSCRFIADFFGLDFDALFAAPRVWDHFVKAIFETVKKDMAALGVHTPKEMLAGFKQVLGQCLAGKPPVAVGPPSRRTLVMWGQPAEVGELEACYARSFDARKR